MDHFTPIASTVGGLLIGLSALLLLKFSGRLAGVSSIVSGLVYLVPGEILWRLLFLAGLVAGAGACYAILGGGPVSRPGIPVPLLVVSGVLIGAGTSFAGGCTSGHGVCGLGRLSRRSLVATITFMVAGALTVYVVRHVLGIES